REEEKAYPKTQPWCSSNPQSRGLTLSVIKSSSGEGKLERRITGLISVLSTRTRTTYAHELPRYGLDKEDKQLDARVHRKYVYGGHVAAYIRTLIEDEPEKYQTHFSEYIKKGIEADGIEELSFKGTSLVFAADPTKKEIGERGSEGTQEVQLEEADI
ncbi:hypothetical protein IFM89_015420, partial [Coptis chinensis]